MSNEKKGIEGVAFVATGDFENFGSLDARGYPDLSDLKKFIEARGGFLRSSVSAKTNYLICNDPNSTTVKMQTAKELGVPVISEKEFLQMAGTENVAKSTPAAKIVAPPGVTIKNGVLTKYRGGSKTITIPAGVTAIGKKAFSPSWDIEEVTIPGSVKTIAVSAFEDCYHLRRVTFAEGLLHIEENAFKGSGITALDLPKSIQTIGASAFRNCHFIESIRLPESIEQIGPYAFYLGASADIFVYAIHNASSALKELTVYEAGSRNENILSMLPAALERKFVLDKYLRKRITISNDLLPMVLDWLYDFRNEALPFAVELGNTEAVNILLERTKKLKLEILEGCIEKATKKHNAELSAMLLAYKDRVYPPKKAAQQLEKKTEKELDPAVQYSVKEMKKQWRFRYEEDTVIIESYCGGEKDVIIPPQIGKRKVVAIEESAFRGYTIQSVVIPESVTEIRGSAFCKCVNLKEITIPSSVSVIGGFAFSECTALTKVTIPAEVTELGFGAFENCTNLTSVEIHPSTIDMKSGAFRGCEKLADSNGMVVVNNILFDYFGPGGDIVIPNGVSRIAGDAFKKQKKELTSLELPATVTQIDENVFSDCENLVKVNIPSSVKRIGSSAFRNCRSLAKLDIHPDVTNIGDRAFSRCEKLADQDGMVIVNGVLEGYYGPGGHVTIPDYVTKIAESAFSGRKDLTGLTISPSIKHIGFAAFAGCENLADENGLVIVNGVLCDYCGSGGKVVIPPGVTSIDRSALRNCSGITHVTIPEGVTEIKERQFSECNNLQGVKIPTSVTVIGAYAFKECRKLRDVVIPDGVVSIGEWAFEGSMTEILIPDSVTSIGNFAFRRCMCLRRIVIPESFDNIGEYTFPKEVEIVRRGKGK